MYTLKILPFILWTSQKDLDGTLSKRDDFPKRQIFQVGVSIIMFLSDVNLLKELNVSVLRKLRIVKKELRKKVEGLKGE